MTSLLDRNSANKIILFLREVMKSQINGCYHYPLCTKSLYIPNYRITIIKIYAIVPTLYVWYFAVKIYYQSNTAVYKIATVLSLLKIYEVCTLNVSLQVFPTLITVYLIQ